MFFFDSTMILILPALALTIYAQFKVKSAFTQMSKVRSASGLTGADVAKSLLKRNSIYDVAVEEVSGNLTDHYDSKAKKLRLSSDVYHSSSLAALGVAAHETGHAIQHKMSYAPLNVRQSIFPVANLGSSMGIPLFIGGLIFSIRPLLDLGIIVFTGAVVFHIVTLPVEFNASSRAMAQLSSGGYLKAEEVAGAKKVLNAAALTYVAAAAMAVLQLVRLILIRGND